MPVPGPGYSITMRIAAPPSATAAGELTTAVGQDGGVITAFDVVESAAGQLVVDLSANATSAAHADEITAAVNNLAGCQVRKLADRTFLVHLGGKIEVTSKVPLRNRDDCRIVVSGVGAAGSAVIRLLLLQRPKDIVGVDIAGIVHRGRAGMDPNLAEVAGVTNAGGLVGSIHDAIAGADVFIGVSAPNVIEGGDVAAMNPGAVVFALANPDPQIDSIQAQAQAQAHAAVVATGRSDFPTQINNVLGPSPACSGVCWMCRPAKSPARCWWRPPRRSPMWCRRTGLNASSIAPSVFDENMSHAVSRAVVAALRTRVRPGGGAKESAMQ